MMLRLGAFLLGVLGAGLLHVDARAQVLNDDAFLAPVEEPVTADTEDPVADPIPTMKRTTQIVREMPYENWIVLELTGAPRREILSRLFAGREVEIEWRNKAFADEAVRGRLKGAPTELARRLLERANYVMAYNNSGALARIVVLGSDPPSVTRSADAPSPARQKPQATEVERKRQAIEATKRAIKDAQRR